MPFHAPVQVRAGCPTRRADSAEHLPLTHQIAFFYCKTGAMEKGTGETHAMIDNQQMTFQREGFVYRSEHDDPIGGGNEGRACSRRDIDPAMVTSRRTAIDALRPEEA